MPTKLEEILANTLLEVQVRKSAADCGLLERQAAAHTPRGFIAALRSTAATHPAIIAELKKASPSKGLIRAEFDPVALAGALEAAGAAALSVLTDSAYFQGSLANLEKASATVRIPCLRKDFVVDPFQILEARAAGADAILLIVAAHDDATLASLRDQAATLNLDVLCETHNREEMQRAIDLGFGLIGVNSRDLRTFTMHPELLPELASLAPAGSVLVAESGLRSREDILALREAGYHAFLIGETLMREADPAATLALLLDRQYAAGV